jgi:hypothetical protein
MLSLLIWTTPNMLAHPRQFTPGVADCSREGQPHDRLNCFSLDDREETR